MLFTGSLMVCKNMVMQNMAGLAAPLIGGGGVLKQKHISYKCVGTNKIITLEIMTRLR